MALMSRALPLLFLFSLVLLASASSFSDENRPPAKPAEHPFNPDQPKDKESDLEGSESAYYPYYGYGYPYYGYGYPHYAYGYPYNYPYYPYPYPVVYGR